MVEQMKAHISGTLYNVQGGDELKGSEAKQSEENKGRALKTTSISLCSVTALFFIFTLLCTLSLFFLSNPPPSSSSSSSPSIKVYVADLPRSLNYDLLRSYWSSSSPDHPKPTNPNFPPYPQNPLIKQYSAEYWILGDLITPPHQRSDSFATRVSDAGDADVVFVPFFATLSAEMQLASSAKGVFRKKDLMNNEDYRRQREVVNLVKSSEAWKRSGGRDHVFVLTDPVAMWHVRAELAPAILLVVDFGGWYRLEKNENSLDVIQHTQVSVIKDVIVPYTHLLPRMQLADNKKRKTLLYFKGAKHRHRGGVVREKLWDLLFNEPNVIMEEGFPNATGREQSIKGMRTSEFCLRPAGDTPTSCRLFDAIQSLCIPVVVSDNIELPFEGMIDYLEFSVFIDVGDALRPNWLVNHLNRISKAERDRFRQKMAEVQPVFQYENGLPGGIGPIPPDGAVNHNWRKVYQKVPLIKEAIARERRKPSGVSVPRRCHCT